VTHVGMCEQGKLFEKWISSPRDSKDVAVFFGKKKRYQRSIDLIHLRKKNWRSVL
jgi:hypothetical protein